VSGVTTTASATEIDHQPSMNLDFPDPEAIRVGATFFAFATNIDGANVPVARSGDMQHWRIVADAIPSDHYPKWASMRQLTWAPGGAPGGTPAFPALREHADGVDRAAVRRSDGIVATRGSL
jgi:hypothetical protein